MQENQIPEKFLPVGTVVLLKNGKNKIPQSFLTLRDFI